VTQQALIPDHCFPPLQGAGEASIAILVDAHLSQFDAVRRPRGGFWNRFFTKISQRAFPGGSDVRGHIVAAESLIDALIQHGNSNRRELFVYPEGKARVAAKLNLLESSEQRKQVRINSIFDAFGGVESYKILAWFNPIPSCRLHGGIEVSYGIRTRSASKPFPITTLLHGLAEQNLVNSIYLRFLLEPTLPCDSIICTSRAARDSARRIVEHLTEEINQRLEARAKFNGRFDVIPLCVDTSVFQPRDKAQVRRTLKLPQDAFLILYFGKISLSKGDLYPFLRAFQELVRRNPNRRLLWVIAGTESPGYTELLGSRARELGVAQHIRIFLDISDESKSLLLSASDVFISPVDTLNESFGLAPVEAMACGTPQVVPDWDGYRDTVSHGETGFLTPTYWTSCCSDLTDTGNQFDGAFNRLCLGQSIAVDMRESIRYVQTLIDNDVLRQDMARQSRQRALKLYTFSAIVRQYEELWAELAGIACRLPSTDKPNISLGRLHYYDLFGNYASTILTANTILQFTELGREAIGADLPVPPDSMSPPGLRVLDTEILRRALMVMNQADSSRRDKIVEKHSEVCRLQMGELTRRLVEECENNSDYVRRHIMWLIKYSYLKPVLE